MENEEINNEIKPRSNKRLLIVLGVLAIILLLFGCYAGYIKYKQNQQERETEIFNLAGSGIAQLLYQEAAECKTIPIGPDDKKLNLIAIECLQRGE
jgi:flagellar basal body-associated protein FliL